MALDSKKYGHGLDHFLRDTRPLRVRIAEWMANSNNAVSVYVFFIALILFLPHAVYLLDLIFLLGVAYFWWLVKHDKEVPYKMPMTANKKFSDPKNQGAGRSGKAEGILYVGNKDESGEEVWFSNSDARTHILFLGTTGSGKTEGLKALATNALCWASGFVYIDGKADTDLWSSLSSLVRRFGRDDDLFVLNYMTGNSDERAASNTMNPFSSGSASYLTQMLVSLMPEAEGDNAMWKERAVSLIGSVMPALTWKRDNQDIPLSISSIRKYLELGPIIRLSRDEAVPEKLRESLVGYLNTLPGYVDAAFDDDGNEKPAGPDTPMVDTQVVRQQHGYLSMQFTRALQSLGDDYGYIFDSQAADINMIDIVLNRRIMVTLIPALEKSSDEIANLGKIVAATIKGMMGSTLGASVEGSSASTIENKPTHSATPFMTIFDEVGYYTTSGMAVMAAQARSLGFCLVYAAQDLPAMEKRVKEEARSIAGNCNIKIFGKLEDPTQTKEFFDKVVGDSLVTEVTGFDTKAGDFSSSYTGGTQASLQIRANADYNALGSYPPGKAVFAFSDNVNDVNIFYADTGAAKAMRVQRFLPLPPPTDSELKNVGNLAKLRDRMVSKTWTAAKAESPVETPDEIAALAHGYEIAEQAGCDLTEAGSMAIVEAYAALNGLDPSEISGDDSSSSAASTSKAPSAPKKETEKVTAGGAPQTNPDGTQKAAGDKTWDELSASEQRDDGEEEGEAQGGSGGGKQPKIVGNDIYNAEDAVEALANDGEYLMPDGLSDDVKNILMGAADNIKSGLFNQPQLQQGQDAQAGQQKPKTIIPKKGG